MTRCWTFSVMTQRALQIQSAGSAARADTNRKKLKIRNIEWLRKEIFQSVRFGFAVQVDQHDLDIAAEFPEDLPAGAARRREHCAVGGHRDSPKRPHTFGNRLKDRYAFGAERESVSSVLHVAAGMDTSLDVFESRAHQ